MEHNANKNQKNTRSTEQLDQEPSSLKVLKEVAAGWMPLPTRSEAAIHQALKSEKASEQFLNDPKTVHELLENVATEENRATEANRSEAETGGSEGNVQTVMRPGYLAETTMITNVTSHAPGALEKVAHTAVTPGGSPTTGSADNTCLPSTSSAVLDWAVIEDGDDYRVNVTSLTLSGNVNVKPWPSAPTNPSAAKNTANPVDGGNITEENYKDALDDMQTYNQSGGGAGPTWHATQASYDHEWMHWNTDYKTDSVASAEGGNWPSVNTQIDALTTPKQGTAGKIATGLASVVSFGLLGPSVNRLTTKTPEQARAALSPRVDDLKSGWRSRTIRRWNSIPDEPGNGGRGYAERSGSGRLHLSCADLQSQQEVGHHADHRNGHRNRYRNRHRYWHGHRHGHRYR